MSCPLAGISVLVTRPKQQASEFVARLEELGAEVIQMPAIEIAPPADPEPLAEALRNIDRYDWIVFTSVNGVSSVFGRIDIAGLKIAAIGPATAAAAETAFGRQADLVPAEFVSEAIAEAIGDVAGQRFLLPRADIARKDLAVLLREKGAVVDEVAAYRIVRAEAPDALPDDPPDFITLTSASAARGTFELLKEAGRGEWFSRAKLISIGPITSAMLRELGFEPAAEASEYTMNGVIDALLDCARAKEKSHA